MDWLNKIFKGKNNSELAETNSDVFDIFNISEQQKQQNAARANAAIEEAEMQEIAEERENQEQAIEGKLVVIDGAKIKMGPHLGVFKVLNDVPTTQDKRTATIAEKQISNLVFTDGFQVLSIDGDWQNYGTYQVQDNEVLLKESKIQITGKMPGNSPTETGFVEFIDSGQLNAPEEVYLEGAPVPPSQNQFENKCIVHFRRPLDYNGKYGFDWLRDEYVHPIITVTNDNNGIPIGVPTPLCKNVSDLKREYLDGRIYGKEYYPAWLAIFPYTTTAQFAHGSTMHKDGVKLDLEIEEIDALQQDSTELIFESNNQYLSIKPDRLNLKDMLVNKKTKSLSGTNVNYYTATKKITVKCSGGALDSHSEINVYKKNGTLPRVQVGKLKVYKNNVIPKAEIVAVNVITNPNQKASLRNDYEYLFKNQSFNQALIRAEVKVDTEFDINSLPNNDQDVINFLNNNSSMDAEQKRNWIQILYERYGKYKPSSSIDDNANKRTYLFYTNLNAGSTNGICSLNTNTNIWGNHYVVFNSGTNSQTTVVHECGHSFSLPHIFSTTMSQYEFYHGYTDNYMDYNWQKGNRSPNGGFYSSGPNLYSGKMFSFYKWQWEIIREDRSLIFNY